MNIRNRALMMGLMLSTLSGCASMSTETRIEETIWQGANIADAYTTNQIVNHTHGDGFEDGDWQHINGRFPTKGQIIADAALSAGLHFAVTAYMADHNLPMWMQRTWQLVTITGSGLAISNNHRVYSDWVDGHRDYHHERHHDKNYQPGSCMYESNGCAL